MSSDGRGGLPLGQVHFDRVSKRYSGATRPTVRTVLPWSDPLAGIETFCALDDLSFEVGPGERLGIIGPNGAGKSTVLKMLAGVVVPTTGSVGYGGRLGQMIELGLGFHPELTGRENIALSAALFGLSRAEASEHTEQIARFAGVEAALDTPLKRYSTGMSARLGFAIATQIHADVLAIDEVLSVGDREFQERCVARIDALVRSGVTLVLVSHEMGLVEMLCDRVLHLRDGRVVEDGPAAEVIERYLVSGSSRSDPVGESPVRLHGFSLVEDHIDPWGVVHVDLDLEVLRPVPRMEALFEMALPTFTPDRPFARCLCTLPGAACEVGRHALRGVSSPMPMDGGHVRVTVRLVDPAHRLGLAEADAAFRVRGSRSGSAKPYLAADHSWTLEPADRAQVLIDRQRAAADRVEHVVELDRATKRYRRGRRRTDLRQLLPGALGQDAGGEVAALDSVSVALEPGEAVGVIGPNGAGKTTLLRAVAGVTGLTSGSVVARGRIVSILELGVGMYPDYTGLENIEMSAMLLGLRRSDVERRVDDILAFAGIGEAKDRPVKHYSSGMRARLGLAIALHVDADLVLIDELLGVGDHEFRVQAMARIRELQFIGSTVLFVSHNLHLVSELCERAIRLEKGRLVADGPTGSVVDSYGGAGWAMGSSTGDSEVRIHDLQLESRWVPSGDPLRFEGWVEVAAPSPNVRLELSYRAVPEDREIAVTPGYVEEHTFVLITVEPAGGVLTRPGWYRFAGQVDRNLLAGRLDVVVAVVDEIEGEILNEGWQSVTFGTPASEDLLGPPLRFEWEDAVDVEQVAGPAPV